MERKINLFKTKFADIIQLCCDLDSRNLTESARSLYDRMDELESDDDAEYALSLLDELMVHVNDLDEDITEPHQDAIMEIQELNDEIIEELNSI